MSLESSSDAVRNSEHLGITPEFRIALHASEVWAVTAAQQLVYQELESPDPTIVTRMEARMKAAQMDASSAFSWRKTLESDDWNERLWEFVRDFFTNDPIGQKILRVAAVSDLQKLTPAQAIYVSTALVSSLRVYDQDYIANNPNLNKLIMSGRFEHTSFAPDSMSVLDILKLGKRLKSSSDRNSANALETGNGVCRNFADAVRAVFESLKYHQHPSNFLHHTVCVQERGDSDRYEPVMENLDPEKQSFFPAISAGHAWNRFITFLGENGKEIEIHTVVDSTWSRFDSATGKMSHYDYSAKRTSLYCFEKLYLELIREKNLETKREIIGSMFDLTARALSALPASEIVMNDEMATYLLKRTDIQNRVATVRQKNNLSHDAAVHEVLEQWRQSTAKWRQKSQAEYYTYALLKVIRSETALLSAAQKKQVLKWTEQHLAQDTEISLEVFLRAGASPFQLQERMKAFIPKAARDDKTHSLALSNPWLQVWVYGLGTKDDINRLELIDERFNDRVWYFRPAAMRDPEAESAHYSTANEFWYDIWRALVLRSDATQKGELRVSSHTSESLELWLDVLAHVWIQQSFRRDAVFHSGRKPLNMTKDHLKKQFSFQETTKLLTDFIEHSQSELDAGKVKSYYFSSGKVRQITERELRKLETLLNVLGFAETTKQRMGHF